LLSDDAVDELLRQLPAPPQPQGNYVPAVAHAGLVVTAGMTPRVDGVLVHRGHVGLEVSVEEAKEAAAIAVGNAVAAVLATLAPGRRLDRVLRLTVYVSCGRNFTAHSAVADGASARLRQLLGALGSASRSAVGVSSLPGGACVEVELTCTWAGRSESA
jgi:enamine deaminase RidA (YjgF/YER057c/UK114 family)